MVAHALPPLDLLDVEPRVLLNGVPWETYIALSDALSAAGDHSHLTYLEGSLEIMGTSQLHEEAKKIIARLLETWADELDVDLRGFGGMTFRRKVKKRGLEPDECYTLGPMRRQRPDLAIEVVVGNPMLDKLDVYAGLDVPEVWVWAARAQRIDVHHLSRQKYTRRWRSELLPAIDLALLAKFVRPGESHTALAKAYRRTLAESRD